MDFDLSEEQRLLKESLDRLIGDRYGFEQRKTYGQAPVDNLWDEGCTLPGVTAVAQKPAPEYDGREERFECQGAPEGLHCDHRLDRTAG